MLEADMRVKFPLLQNRILRRLKMTTETANYDVVIVGGRTGLGIIASRVTQTTSFRAFVLEAGQDNNADPKVTIPGRNRAMFGDPS